MKELYGFTNAEAKLSNGLINGYTLNKLLLIPVLVMPLSEVINEMFFAKPTQKNNMS